MKPIFDFITKYGRTALEYILRFLVWADHNHFWAYLIYTVVALLIVHALSELVKDYLALVRDVERCKQRLEDLGSQIQIISNSTTKLAEDLASARIEILEQGLSLDMYHKDLLERIDAKADRRSRAKVPTKKRS